MEALMEQYKIDIVVGTWSLCTAIIGPTIRTTTTGFTVVRNITLQVPMNIVLFTSETKQFLIGS